MRTVRSWMCFIWRRACACISLCANGRAGHEVRFLSFASGRVRRDGCGGPWLPSPSWLAVMRHAQPLNADEQRVDAAIRARGGSHGQQDEALLRYRIGKLAADRVTRYENLSRVADLMLGEFGHDGSR